MIRKFSLYDLWRIAHPTERTFSFFSSPHGSNSRIDYFLGNLFALRRFIDADIGHITWSDHAPILLKVDFERVATRVCHWCLNESLLKKSHLREESRIKRDIATRVESLMSTLHTLEGKLSIKPSKRLLRQILAIRSKLQTLAM